MKGKEVNSDYYLGLDIGTNSVGWAVTDENYNLLKANRKYLWGVRLFETANTAEDRRLHRSARRRNQRKVQRLQLLKEMFEPHIKKVDPTFFDRLEQSYLHDDDKLHSFNYTLFDDKEKTDPTFFKKYPTIFHLRSYLVHNRDDNVDLRELYLAIHHILKTRGHFLFSGENLNTTSSFETLVEDLKNNLQDSLNIDLTINGSNEEFGEILKITKKREKKKELNDILIFSVNNEEGEPQEFSKVESEIKNALAGSPFTIGKLFANEEYEEFEPAKIVFDKDDYEATKEKLEQQLTLEEFSLIETFEGLYSWALLAEVLRGREYISDAKIDVYEKHKEDLISLKKLVKKYEKGEYNNAFKLFNKDNYPHYVGKSSKGGVLVKSPFKSKCTQEDVCKYFSKLLTPHKNSNDPLLTSVLDELDNKSLLPKLRVKDNRVIPHQLHVKELKEILNNVERYFPFLNEADEDGYTPVEKMVAMATFRIPYYVGPLNTYHMKEGGEEGFAWMIRRSGEDGPIYPWNFEKVVDIEKSAEKFIRRMTNKCSYLFDKDVVAKDSLIYSKYRVLNELNNLRINGEPISVELKQKIYNELFLESKRKNITIKQLKTYFVNNNLIDKNDEFNVEGIDNGFTNSLSTWIDFAPFLENEILLESEIENIIEWKAYYGEDDSILKRKIENEYKKLDSDQINSILKIVKPYKGWGRLSKELLEEVFHEDPTTGALHSILDLMWNTNNNLMELLSTRFTFVNEIDEYNKQNASDTNFNYKSLIEPLNISPAVKRQIWQTLIIVREIKKIQRKAPKKVFLEMARGGGIKGQRTKSRRVALIELYEACKNDYEFNKELLSSIEQKTDAELRNDTLYLYYTQMGKCLYSGEPIRLEDVNKKSLYDIDHIYPQSLIKDDSLNNRVLVKANYNSEKKNDYPIKEAWQSKQSGFWRVLLDKGFITKEKYFRLTRKTRLTDEDLATFINRQIVETRQTTKLVGTLLENLFGESKTKLVYSKAGNVSEFRKDFDILKSRSINDHHHAHDAYLNIVVGNVYNTKFTENAWNFFKLPRKESYNIRRLYYYDVERNNSIAWIADKNFEENDRSKKHERTNETGTITTIRDTFRNNQILVTRKPITGSGELFDLQPLKGKDNLIPLKGSNPILHQTEKYGGYDSKKTGYFFVVEHTHKKKRIKQIRTVPIMNLVDIQKNPNALMDYCINTLQLEEPKILIDKIHLHEKVKVDNFFYMIRGITGRQIFGNGEHQLVLPQESYDYFVTIEKYLSLLARTKTVELTANAEILADDLGISKHKNRELYELFLIKERDTLYKKRKSNQKLALENGLSIFENIDVLKQCIVLVQITNLFACNPLSADLSLIGGVKNAGVVLFNSTVTDDFKLIRSSPTGVFTKEVSV